MTIYFYAVKMKTTYYGLESKHEKEIVKSGVIFDGDINSADDFHYIRDLIYERVKDGCGCDTFVSDISLISFNKI